MTVLNPPVWIQAGTAHPDADRLISSVVVDRNVDSAGVLKSIEGGVVPPLNQLQPTVLGYDMNVTFSGGTVIVPRVGNDPAGVFLCHNQGNATVSIAPATTQPRFDIIVAEVLSTLQGDATNEWRLRVIQGTEAASPTEPAVTGSKVRLARVRVIPAGQNGGTNKIAASQLTDQRSFVAGLGGVHLAWNGVLYPQHSPGRLLYDVSSKTLQVSNGTVWETLHTLEKTTAHLATLRPRQVFHNGELATNSESWTSTPSDIEQGGAATPISIPNISSPSGQFKVTISAYGRVDAVGQAGHVSVEARRASGNTVEAAPFFGYGPSFYNTLTNASSMTAIIQGPANTAMNLNVVFTKRNGGAGDSARFWRVRMVVEPLI